MPSMTSDRLWGSILVAIPTAMPEAPLMMRLGIFVGRTVGSSKNRQSCWQNLPFLYRGHRAFHQKLPNLASV